jgi:hypothetical protein
MDQLKTAKIFFCLAVMLLVAKPFLGFTIFNNLGPSNRLSIGVKAFTKRKQEYAEDSENNMLSLHKKLADPVEDFFLRISLLLSIILPAVFNAADTITNSFLRNLQSGLLPREHTYLLNSSLII